VIATRPGVVAAEARVVTVRWDPDRHEKIPFTADERAQLGAALAGGAG
jgi:hypothetical protein